jgi:hypothetical protein
VIRLSDDQSRLDCESVMDDPIAFEEPAAFRYQYLAFDYEFLENCQASNRGSQ